MTENQDCDGSVLGYSEIAARAEEIFGDTWNEGNLRAAKYYLTVAEDLIIFPGGERQRLGEKVTEPIILQPGQVLLVTTAERLTMPWDLTGQVSLRFSYALRGALVLTGGTVDPGYGQATPSGERLHFLIANIGRDHLGIHPGVDQIASLQFIKVCGDAKSPLPPASTADMERRLFEAETVPELPLKFFQQVATVDRELETSVVDLRARFSAIETGTKSLIYFGVFLLAATLFGVSLAVFFQLASDRSIASLVDRLDDVLPDTWPAAIVVVATLAGLTFILWQVMGLMERLIRTVGSVVGRGIVRLKSRTRE